MGGAMRRAAPAAVTIAIAVALALGVLRGWGEAAIGGIGGIGGAGSSGFPMLLLASVRTELDWALAGAALFLVLYGVLRGVVGRSWSPRLAVPVAAAVALAPVVAAGGYRLNRTAGIRPTEILAAYPLKLNLEYLGAALVVLCALVAWLLHADRPDARAGSSARAEAAPWRSRGAGAVLFALALLALVHGAGAIAFSGPPRTAGARPDAPDVVIILVDALRADHVGAYGHERDTTPAIDSLASDGVLFRQAISQSTFTKSSIASLFTGRYPYQHGVYWGSRTADPEFPGAVTSDVLPTRERTLAEMLRRRGLFTAAWVHNSHLRKFMGFGQGFALYRDQAGDAARITRLATDWFDGPGRRYRTFAYIHYIDVHDPYRPEPPYDTLFGPYDDPYAGVDLAAWGEHLEAIREGRETVSPERLAAMKLAYDGQIRSVDDQIGRLLETLRRTGRYDDSLIVVTADHGDGFMEHGFIAHSTTPYDELVRVPLIVKLPRSFDDRRDAGSVVTEQVRLVDLVPTILGVVHAPVPDDLAGCSLLPLIQSESEPSDESGAGAGEGKPGVASAADTGSPASADDRPDRCRTSVTEIAAEGAEPTVAVRTAEWKVILHGDGQLELYDLAADPGEHHDLSGVEGAFGRPEPARLLAVARHAVEARTEAVGRIELEPEDVRKLKALGYVQ